MPPTGLRTRFCETALVAVANEGVVCVTKVRSVDLRVISLRAFIGGEGKKGCQCVTLVTQSFLL